MRAQASGDAALPGEMRLRVRGPRPSRRRPRQDRIVLLSSKSGAPLRRRPAGGPSPSPADNVNSRQRWALSVNRPALNGGCSKSLTPPPSRGPVGQRSGVPPRSEGTADNSRRSRSSQTRGQRVNLGGAGQARRPHLSRTAAHAPAGEEHSVGRVGTCGSTAPGPGSRRRSRLTTGIAAPRPVPHPTSYPGVPAAARSRCPRSVRRPWLGAGRTRKWRLSVRRRRRSPGVRPVDRRPCVAGTDGLRRRQAACSRARGWRRRPRTQPRASLTRPSSTGWPWEPGPWRAAVSTSASRSAARSSHVRRRPPEQAEARRDAAPTGGRRGRPGLAVRIDRHSRRPSVPSGSTGRGGTCRASRRAAVGRSPGRHRPRAVRAASRARGAIPAPMPSSRCVL